MILYIWVWTCYIRGHPSCIVCRLGWFFAINVRSAVLFIYDTKEETKLHCHLEMDDHDHCYKYFYLMQKKDVIYCLKNEDRWYLIIYSRVYSCLYTTTTYPPTLYIYIRHYEFLQKYKNCDILIKDTFLLSSIQFSRYWHAKI